MVWSTVHDEMLCREILVVDPFTGTKKGTVARGTKWEEVAENLNKIEQVYFKVDKRAVRDRYNLLSRELRNKLKRFLAALKDVIAVIKRKISASASPSYSKIHNLKYFVFGSNDGTCPSLTLTVPSPS